VFATCSGLCGLATCLGASTVMLGSGAAPVVVCEAAGPHSKTVDKTATAEGATKLDVNLMTIPSQGRTCRPNAPTLPPIINQISELGHGGSKRFPPMTAMDMVAGEEDADYLFAPLLLLSFYSPVQAGYCWFSGSMLTDGQTVTETLKIVVASVERVHIPGKPDQRPWCVENRTSRGGSTNIDRTDAGPFKHLRDRCARRLFSERRLRYSFAKRT
jgi:hypothetical protein